jgi:hypothetical protein
LKVISRLLKDYDHVVKTSAANRIEVTVIKFRGQSGGEVISPPASPYHPGLFQAKPSPNPVQASGKVSPTGASPYPPQLFPPSLPTGRNPVAPIR